MTATSGCLPPAICFSTFTHMFLKYFHSYLRLLLSLCFFDAYFHLQPKSGTTSNSGNQQRPPINLDRLQTAENERNFQQISASLMEIMHDMLSVLPDYLVGEILGMLKYESFIMFAMDESACKRFAALRLFLGLLERSSTASFLVASSMQSLVSAAASVTNNLAAGSAQSALAREG